MVVVTGANGHVGNNLVRALLARGRKVRALVYGNSASLAGLPVEAREGEIRDPDFLKQAFNGAEVVYHTAGRISLSMSDWPLVEAVNVRGVENVLRACSLAA